MPDTESQNQEKHLKPIPSLLQTLVCVWRKGNFRKLKNKRTITSKTLKENNLEKELM